MLPHLRTLHIRNMPGSSGKILRLMAVKLEEDGIEEKGGRRFMKTLAEILYQDIFHPDCFAKMCSKLEVIAIGAPTIADRRIGQGLNRTEELDDFVKPRVFHVKRFYSMDGDQTVQLKLIGEGMTALRDARYHSNYTRVLEPCWAR